MNIGKRFTASFSKNPVAWILGGLLVFSVYSHYGTGSEFTQVCEKIVMLEEGYYDFDTSQQLQPTGIDFDAIMIEMKEHDKLMKTDTPDGRAYRWWREKAQYLIKVCGNRLAEPDP